MKKAFTLVELIIAILIFGAGLLAILVVINKNIIFSKKVKLKTQATFLAKEGIEYVYNLRDSNRMKYYPWDYITGTIDDIKNNNYEKFQTNKLFIPLFSFSGNKISLKTISDIHNARLYIKNITIDNSVGVNIFSGLVYQYLTGEKTPFYRYIFFSGVFLQPEGSIVDTDQMLKINSKVFYNFGSITGEVVLSSFISDWKK